MAWNDPSDQDKDQQRDQEKKSAGDPWSGQKKGSDNAPPDLDEVFRKFSKKLNSMLNKKKGSGGKGFGSGSNGSGPVASLGKKGAGFIVGLAVLLILVIWGLSGIYIVGPAEQGVVLLFGSYSKTVGPGPHWIPRFIESVKVVNVQKVYNYVYSAEMLTRDENIVSVSVAVQYRISNPEKFLYNIVNPRESLQLATASSLRQVVGDMTLNSVLTTGRSLVSQDVNKQLQDILKLYQSGIQVTDIALQPAKAPEQVRAAFDDAIKAREDQQRYVNQAQAYTQDVIPKAQGNAKQMLAQANAYKQQVVLYSEGNTARFLALLPEYKVAPEVMRERLYLTSVESMLAHSSKVLVDTNKSNNVLLLPLSKLMSQVYNPHNMSGNHSSIVPIKPELTKKTSTADYSSRPGRDSFAGRGY